MAADLIRPFPEHCPHGGGYILRAALAGCATVGNPVPSQAEHLTSADVSRDFKVFRPLFPRHDADAAHVVVEQGLLVSIVPLKSHPRPVIFSDRGLVVLVVTPTYPGSDVQQSGTASRSFISPFRCDSIGRHHRSCLPGRLPRPSIPQCVAMLAWGQAWSADECYRCKAALPRTRSVFDLSSAMQFIERAESKFANLADVLASLRSKLGSVTFGHKGAGKRSLGDPHAGGRCQSRAQRDFLQKDRCATD